MSVNILDHHSYLDYDQWFTIREYPGCWLEGRGGGGGSAHNVHTSWIRLIL